MNTGFIHEPVQTGWHPALPSLDFTLPPALEASVPPEARGLRRDHVRLLVSYRRHRRITHSRFDHLPCFLRAGDVLVINTSKTIKAALAAKRGDGKDLELHLSTRLAAGHWIVEVREPGREGTLPFYQIDAGMKLSLPAGGEAVIALPYPGHSPRKRLWHVSLNLPQPVDEYIERYGFPIQYKYVKTKWPIDYYQNVYATEPGSAEMPSAGRAFTPELITLLRKQGIRVAPLLLHTGVASLEEDETPYAEYYRVPAATADLINTIRSRKGRVIAVGTTVIRALQTITGLDGRVRAGEGWTDLVVKPDTRLGSVDGLLTGFHEPRSTHLSMLFAIAGEKHIRLAYQQALEKKYLWHEFGDLHLILP
jgi:S-adenosylmethionine:tRNA ribosyltransferase-isomerase